MDAVRSASGIVLASVFAAAASAKIRDVGAFAQSLAWFLDRRQATQATYAVISVELSVAAAFAAATVVDGVAEPVRVGAVGFVLAATALYAVSIVRGHALTCNCFGGPKRPPKTVGGADDRRHDGNEGARLALRNSIIVSLATAPIIAPASLLVLAAMPQVVVAAALVVDIISQRRERRRPMPALVPAYAPHIQHLVTQMWWVAGGPRSTV